jgi:hypothetical protein
MTRCLEQVRNPTEAPTLCIMNLILYHPMVQLLVDAATSFDPPFRPETSLRSGVIEGTFELSASKDYLLEVALEL